MESGTPSKSKKCNKERCTSPKKHGPKSPEHSLKSPEHDPKLWQAKEQVLSMPSPRREFRECVVMRNSNNSSNARSQSNNDTSSSNHSMCCGPDKKGEGFSRMAVLYFMFFSSVFVLAIIGLRMFTIEDKLLRLDTDYQQQQMRIEALEEKISQLTKKGDESIDYYGQRRRTKRETAEC
ncbi:hypothetical protein X975_22283, partial [Stegodyphus mimosarum]